MYFLHSAKRFFICQHCGLEYKGLIMNRIILICLIIASTGLFAQEINFCLNYTVLGEPLRVSNSWSINEDGGYLYVLYKQPEAITRNLFSIVVSQAQDGVFREINRQRIVPELNKNWVAIYYKFHQQKL